MCFSGKYTEAEVYKKLVGNGGFNAYLGTNDMRDVEKMVDEGDTKAAEVRDAFIQQMSKNIGAMATVLEGKVDQIIVTGGIAYDKGVVDGLKARCEWIAPFTVYPGEDELLALAQGALRVMNGEEEAKKALDGARAVFAGGGSMENIPTTVMAASEFEGEGMGVVNLIRQLGLVPSNGEGFRTIEQGGLTVAGKKVTDTKMKVTADMFEDGKLLIQKGKKKFHMVELG